MRRTPWVIVSVLLPLFARAAPSEVGALRQQVAALQLDRALALTQQQAVALLPLLQNAKADVQAARAQRDTSSPALVAALTQAVGDLKASGAVSDATAQAVNAARPSPGALRTDLQSIWQQAKGILTSDQLQTLKTVQLGIPPAGASSAAQPSAGFARRARLMHVILSDAFVSLVQTRAG
jgi:hypothetical protein